MKNIWKYIALAATMAFGAACAPEYPEPKQGDLPQASELNVTIDVDQSTNYATFNVSNTGLVPVWIFGTELIDGKAGKQYAYVGNNIRLRFREAGSHSVEVKAYNANGLSVGSQTVTFSMNETYRDPFDPSPYMKAIAGSWEWNSSKDGHFGCGPIGDEQKGLGWWSCGANGKDGWSLYDDILTFTEDGKYSYDPGDGFVYCNSGSGYKSEYNTNNEDYLVPIEGYTTTYTIENEWNDAGIEDIFLVLASGANLSYVASENSLKEPRYQFIDTKTAEIKKTLKLYLETTSPGNPDGISWHYEFVPQGSGPVTVDPLYGITSKVWVIDNETQGYMGCGPDVTNPTGWWSATPHDKDNYGVTDDKLTFFKDGKYIFDPGEDGMVYVNWESGYRPDGYYSGDGSTDYDAPAEVIESTYTLGTDENGDYIELPAGVLYGYVANKAVLEEVNRLTVKELTDSKMVLVANFSGISWQFIYRPADGQDFGGGDEEQEPVEELDPTNYDLEGATNLWRSATLDVETWYSPSDWSGGITPEYSVLSGNGIEVTIPDGVGGGEWQGQTKLKSGIATSSEKTYDLSVTLTADEDMTVTIKLTNDPEEDNDIHAFFYDGQVTLAAGESLTYRKSNVSQSVSGDNLMLIFDFGRSPVGSTIEVTDIIFQEHQEGNLWAGANLDVETWYSPSDWSGGVTPEYETTADKGIIVTIPEGTGGGEWQGQTKLKSGIATSSDKVYDFSVQLTADEDMTVTIKVTNDPEEDNDIHSFFYDGGVQIKAGETLTYVKKGISQSVSGDNLMVIFDFGRSPVGSTIEARNIVFMEHK